MSCENTGTIEKDAVMLRRPKFDRSKLCVKCKLNPGNVVIRHSVFCKTCFFPLVTTKFKRGLDPYINPKSDASRRKTLKASGNLLLSFSGGLGSTVLIDLVNQCYLAPFAVTEDGKPKGGKDHPRNGRVWKKVTVCYVETSSAYSGARDRLEDVRQVVNQYQNVEFIPLRIEDAFNEDWWTQNGGRLGDSTLRVELSNEDLPLSAERSPKSQLPREALKQFLSSLPTQTAIITAIQNLVRVLLLHTAHVTESSHLLLGTSLTSLSIAHISSIAQGGGFTVREEAQEEWAPDLPIAGSSLPKTGQIQRKNIRVIRPLRDVGMKECGIWAWWRGLHIVGREMSKHGKQEIGSLTRDFIVGLEADYPSTVSTIARTCAKVESKEEPAGATICIGLHKLTIARPAQRDVQGWKSRISIRSYPFDLTDPHLPLHTKSSSIVPPLGASHSSGVPADPLATLTPHLCYLCHTTLTSRSSRGTAGNGALPQSGESVPLPAWVASRLYKGSVSSEPDQPIGEIWETTKMDEKDMKNVIAEYLIPDE
ncbi:hypothetical protein AMATHDRAFT_84234 [Amanita thiersii Skay4041]|uniref:Cytoplasmic tRNA 2-thiolation protein 2 n=1 Tax=Amanita thiersii Skay4041 TaxID=703135 RepID=A0A2A9NSC7_9AGAR|nr:hypothetical protein AMATHDRAFT_84234 [Amanita thiersii Skay4041]